MYDEVSYFMGAADGRDSLASFGAWWGLPIALLGLYFIVGRFVVRAIVSRRTRYVLTDQRLLVIGGLSGTRTTSSARLPDRSDASTRCVPRRLGRVEPGERMASMGKSSHRARP